MSIERPTFLWLLFPLVLVAGWGWYRRAGAGRRTLVAALQLGGFVAVVLALARPVVGFRSDRRTTVVVVDLSPTARADTVDRAAAVVRNGRAAGDVRVVAFSNRASVVPDAATLTDPVARGDLAARLAEPLWPDDRAAGGSDLAAALQLAGAQVPTGGWGEVVLFADGLSTRGDAAAAAFRLAERGISVTTTPVSLAPGLPTALVRSVAVPARARVGQTVSARVVVESRLTAGGTIVLSPADGSPVRQAVRLVPGLNDARVDLPLHAVGVVTIRAELLVDGAAGGAPLAAVDVDEPARVLVVSDDPADGTAAAVRALLGDAARVIPAGPDALDDARLDDADAVVLADLPAAHLSARAAGRVGRAVVDGTGLLVTGAARSFGPGGYAASPLADLLPVRLPQQMQSINPSTTLVLIIDSSGSMGVRHKLDLAKAVARLAIGHLRPQDKVGICEFYGGKRWAAPIQPLGNSTDITRALDRLTAGGGTKLFPAFEEAAFALHNVQTRTKHVLILSDGDVEDAPFDDLARQMADDGIVVSTVACAPDDGQTFLPSIAQAGRGRYYVVPDEYELPDVSLKQPRTAVLPSVVRTPSPVAAEPDPLDPAVRPGDLGTVDGYVRTAAKPTADVLLRAGGDPLLARWRYGAGWVAALPTQLGSAMTADLQGRRDFGLRFAELVRQISRDRPSPLTLQPIVRPAGLEVDVAATNDDPALATDAIRLSLLDPTTGAVVRTVRGQPIEAGRWNLLLADVPAGVYRLSASADGGHGQGQAAVVVPRPRLPVALTPDGNLLRTMTGFAPLAARRAAGQVVGWSDWVDLRGPLIVAAVVLLLANVTARRWPPSAPRPVGMPASARHPVAPPRAPSPRTEEPATVVAGR